MSRGYQHNYSDLKPQMYDMQSRMMRGKRIVLVLQHALSKRTLSKSSILDIGCSTGIITNELSAVCKNIVGVDIDTEAISYAKNHFHKKNLSFHVGDAMRLPFKSNRFDIVTISHVYEHVPDQKKLFDEIYRVLKPEGICFAAFCNKIQLIEPHHDLPLLSMLPKTIADKYMCIMGRGREYYESMESYWGLRKLVKKFKIIEYTNKIITNPAMFGFQDNIIAYSPFRHFSYLFSPISRYFSPTLFWLLVKP